MTSQSGNTSRPGLSGVAARLSLLLLVKLVVFGAAAALFPVLYIITFAFVALLMAWPTWYVVSLAARPLNKGVLGALGLFVVYALAAGLFEGVLVNAWGPDMQALKARVAEVGQQMNSTTQTYEEFRILYSKAAMQMVLIKAVAMAFGSGVLLAALAFFRPSQKQQPVSREAPRGYEAPRPYEAARPYEVRAARADGKASLGHILFSPAGRIGPDEFGRGFLVLTVVRFGSFLLGPVTLLIHLVLFPMAFCLYGKRLEDAGRSRWLHVAATGFSLSLAFSSILVLIVAPALAIGLLEPQGMNGDSLNWLDPEAWKAMIVIAFTFYTMSLLGLPQALAATGDVEISIAYYGLLVALLIMAIKVAFDLAYMMWLCGVPSRGADAGARTVAGRLDAPAGLA